ncbi:hypothetical protein BC351_26080 [Paenibacillus ferrarius]|uniref:Uncharacterized protein n=1 Tax=Paenibacillus ferrarius TaxID=1469647 RepID=A0A1V4HIM9_9BACL|nr:hypothetical protein BC351_26080 [Paenibacillus ferrarius]
MVILVVFLSRKKYHCRFNLRYNRLIKTSAIPKLFFRLEGKLMLLFIVIKNGSTILATTVNVLSFIISRIYLRPIQLKQFFIREDY